jgi:hypothetical protein
MRQPISMTIADVSGFARALRHEAPGAEAGHQSWLNHIARAAGFRNYQHLSAARKGAEPPADPAKVARALRWFDAEGRFARWPSKQSVRELCLWAVWARLPPGEEWDERAISARIDDLTALKDAAQIRRSFVEMGLFTRNIDGTGYARVERRPPPEARALIAALGQKSAA